MRFLRKERNSPEPATPVGAPASVPAMPAGERPQTVTPPPSRPPLAVDPYAGGVFNPQTGLRYDGRGLPLSMGFPDNSRDEERQREEKESAGRRDRNPTDLDQ